MLAVSKHARGQVRPLDNPDVGGSVAFGMPRVRRLIALLLAILWMPLTAHCAIEALGVFEAQDSCCDTEHSCTDAPCSLLSNGEYNPATPTIKVFAPLATPGAPIVKVDELLPRAESGAPIDQRERPPDWVVRWHLVRRAAGTPRAPALVG